ncbi:unnamed protein product, partial [Discosporangium mesarthrocarpum]
MAIWRPKWLRFRVIPPVIQRYVRGHLARHARRRRLARRPLLESNAGKAIPFQRAWRGFLAKKARAQLQKKAHDEWQAAVLLQRAWYRRMGQFPAFVLVSCLRIMDKLDDERARSAHLWYLENTTRIIQRVYLRQYTNRRFKAACLLQAMWRSKMGSDIVHRLRLQHWAERKLRWWLKGRMAYRHSCSSKIAFCWLLSGTGRLLRHLQNCREEEENKWWDMWHRRRDLAASKIQAVVQGQWTRRHLHRDATAVNIQRVVRGFVHRRRAWRRFVEQKRQQAGAFIARLVQQASESLPRRVAMLRSTAGARLGAWARGCVARAVLTRASILAREQVNMAIKLQRKWRNRKDMMSTIRHALVAKRRRNSPFKSLQRPDEAAEAAVVAASRHLNPRNSVAGCGAWKLCRRLGCDEDLLPILRAKGIAGAEALRGMSEENLINMGITNVSMAYKSQHLQDGTSSISGGGSGSRAKGGTRDDNQRGAAMESRVGVFQAAELRNLLLALVCEADPSEPPGGSMRHLFEGFEPIEGHPQVSYPTMADKIRHMFLDFFGQGLTKRADNFANALTAASSGAIVEVTPHQLRRFFDECGTPAKAKDRLPILVKPSSDEVRRAMRDDDRRLAASLQLLSDGADRVVATCRIPHQETNATDKAGGGPSTELRKRLRLLVDAVDEQGQVHRARKAARGSAPEVMRAHWHERLALATELYDILHRLRRMGKAARSVQKVFRSHHGRGILALARHQARRSMHYDDYLFEHTSNHVRAHWEKDRQLEAEKRQRDYDEWLAQEHKRAIEEELYNWAVMRFGWRAEALGADTNAQVYRHYKLVRVKRDGAEIVRKGPDFEEVLTEESMEYPLYAYEEEMASKVLGRAGRAYIARNAVYILRRDKKRAEKEAKERLEWQEAERLADQRVTVILIIALTSNSKFLCEHVAPADVLPEDSHLDLWEGFLLEARSDGGQGNHGGKMSKTGPKEGEELGVWLRAEVVMVNPKDVVTVHGIKLYPKGTFGIRYIDTGKEVPDVPRSCLRVVSLAAGTKIEARYMGREDYYPGVIAGCNIRDGHILSYSVKYDDGDVEKAVRRGNIAPLPEEMMSMQAKADEARRKRLQRGEQRKMLVQRRAARESAWRESLRKAEEAYISAAAMTSSKSLQPTNLQTKKPNELVREGGGSTPRKMGRTTGMGVGGESVAGTIDAGSRVKIGYDEEEPDAAACVGMIEAAMRLKEATKPHWVVALRIDYTYQATRFGWRAVKTRGGASLWKSDLTGAVRKGRPRYNFEEDAAVRKLQATWAGFQGRKEFR